MSIVYPNTWLKRVLVADAVVSGAVALLQLAAAKRVSELTGLSASLLIGTGAFLVAYVALLLTLASRSRLPASLLWLVIVGNVGWAAGALVVATGGLPGLGIALAAIHAVAVTTFAALEYQGLRTSRTEPSGYARSA
jgi:hypothetical protein